MKRPMKAIGNTLGLVCLALTLAGPDALADGFTLRFDPAGSAVRFTLDATLHEVEGTFRLESGELLFDPTDGTLRGEIVVDSRSGETGNKRRDRKMHNSVLDSEQHPRIVFRPANLRGAWSPDGASRFEVEGQIQLHGQAHPLTVPIELEMDGSRFRVRSEFEIPYVAWGLEDPGNFVLRVAKTVRIDLDLVGRLRPEAGPGAEPTD